MHVRPFTQYPTLARPLSRLWCLAELHYRQTLVSSGTDVLGGMLEWTSSAPGMLFLELPLQQRCRASQAGAAVSVKSEVAQSSSAAGSPQGRDDHAPLGTPHPERSIAALTLVQSLPNIDRGGGGNWIFLLCVRTARCPFGTETRLARMVKLLRKGACAKETDRYGLTVEL